MLFCFWLTFVLLFDVSFVNAECVQSFNQAPGFIQTVSVHRKGYRCCEYHIRAPQDCAIVLNITSISGFTSSYSSVNCEPPRLSITEKTTSGSEVVMHLLCPGDHTLPKVYHSTSHHIKLTYVWLPNFTSGFNLHFYFHKNITIITSPLPATSSSSGLNTQILIIVISVAVAVGFVTCVVSHYKMGARSWSEQHHLRHQNHQINNSETTRSTYNNHSSFNHPISAVLCVPPSNGRRIKSNSAPSDDDNNIRLQNNLVANYPPAISMPDGEELPYGSFKNVRIRNADQQSEIYQECVKPPPNRTIFDGATSPSYDSKSIGFLHSKKGCRNHQSSLVRDDRTPLVMPCHSMSSTSYPRPSATSVNSSNSKNRLSVLVIPSRQSHRSQSTASGQTVLQHCSAPIASQISSTSTIPMTNSESTASSSCASGNQQTVIKQNDSPPDYSEVVANPSLYHITTNGRHFDRL